jgi:lysozyme
MTDLTPAIELCKRFEGFRSKPYLCPAGVATIGYGATSYLDGRPVTLSDAPVTKEQAEELLEASIRRIYLPGVLKLCPGLVAYPGALNAVVDFAFNLGVGRLQTSTLRRRVNAQDWADAAEQLRKWVRGGGRVLPGLVKRREAEILLLPL